MAYLNASYETGFANPIDAAIRAHRAFDLSGYRKEDEIPYDFLRKRLSILVSHDEAHLMVTKGALQNVLAVCTSAEAGKGTIVDIATVRDKIQGRFDEFSRNGFRTLGVAYKKMGSVSRISKESRSGHDLSQDSWFCSTRPSQRVVETITSLKNLGVALKIITGDNRLVAASLSKQIGLSDAQLLTGPELHELSDMALLGRVSNVAVFAEIEPNQKERIILALKKAGHVVGYMGDGINDASALHAADVGISVDTCCRRRKGGGGHRPARK